MANKRGKYVETREYVGMIRRCLRALAARVGQQSDVELLADMLALQSDLDANVVKAVAGLRKTYSWAEIAERVGISRQAAHERWAAKVNKLEDQ